MYYIQDTNICKTAAANYPYTRENEEDHVLFYQKVRMVLHLDDTARSLVGSLYGLLLKPGAPVLDLMSTLSQPGDFLKTIKNRSCPQRS